MFKEEFINEFKRFSDEFELITKINNLFPNENSTIHKGKTKISIKHKKCGNIFDIRVDNLFNTKYKNKKDYGKICLNCRYLLTKKEMEDILIEKYGFLPYDILSEYKTTHEKLKLRCRQCNNIIYVSFSNLKNFKNNNLKNYYCPECSKKLTSIEKSKGIDSFLNRLKELSNGKDLYIVRNFKNVNSKCTFICKKCNFKFEALPQNIIERLRKTNGKKYYCPQCNNLIRTNLTYEEKLKNINSDIINIESYKNRKTKILHKCLICNHEWYISPNNTLKGEGCPKCSNRMGKSIVEEEIEKFLISELNIKDIIKRDRIVLEGKEIDIYVPSKNIAIECNGMYWHSDKYKDKNYHLDKTKRCNEKNIRLIQIYDYEWINKKEIVKDKLRDIFGLTKEKIYARECYIKEISSKDKNKFLEENHIQGKDNSCIKLGLYTSTKYYEEEVLVAIMTFCKPRKALGHNKGSLYDYELSRYCGLLDYNVIGGFSKLLKYFERNYEWKKIITYANLRWSSINYENTVYFKNNFEFIHFSKPSYCYYNRNSKEIVSRYNFRKTKLKDIFPNLYDEKLTEFQIVDKTKIWFRVWDCGNLVFIFTKN